MNDEIVREHHELTEAELMVLASNGFWAYCVMAAVDGAVIGGAAGAILGPGVVIGTVAGATVAGIGAAIGYAIFGY